MVKIEMINRDGSMTTLKKKKKKSGPGKETQLVRKVIQQNQGLIRRALPVARPLQPGNYSGGVVAPTAFGGRVGNRSMFPLQRGMGPCMRVTNYEQATAVTGSNGTFSAGGFVINPGLATAFPWLAGIAANYQSFRFHYLRYVWVPSCPTTTAGSAFLYLDYNFNCGEPTSLAQVDVTAGSCTGQPWLGSPMSSGVAFRSGLDASTNIHVNLDPAKLLQPYYNVRTSNNANTQAGGTLGGVIPAGLTFTSGSFPDATGRPATLYFGSNTNTSSVIGIIYACYDVEFWDPVAPAISS